MTKDWYQYRDELRSGQVFRLQDDTIVQLDRRIPGDGTDWYADVWVEGSPGVPGYEDGYFSCEDYSLHPSDLAEMLPENFNGKPSETTVPTY